ncbi:MAG: threonine--tRNA ligase [Pseudomonadota bacterium]|nr:threonine--tRNA ligase [Pseudomonadota bacterium]
MAKIKIHLPDNSIREFDQEPTILEVALNIGARLAKDTVGAFINDEKEIQDFRQKLKDGSRIKIVTLNSIEGREVIRHSAAHVMAQAVQELWPDIKVTIGPVIDNGFYYDFDTPRPFTPDVLEKIEKQMQEVINRDLEIVREEWTSEKAIALFTKMGEKFKVEIIRDLNVPSVSLYRQGDWLDLCRGPHLQKTSQIKAFKILSIASAYWRGDEKRESLQRVYATAFESKPELERHLHNLEEAKKRDHRKLGKELGLIFFHPFSPGGAFFTGKGTIIFNQLQNYMRELYKEYGYQEVITPQLFDVEMYHCSGHYDNYRDNMYFTETDKGQHSFKPMNCPGHCLLYASDLHSYRELPIRFADFGRLHRAERSGTLHGLTRVRSLTQDDAHIFCTMLQLQSEIKSFMQFLTRVYETLGMNKYTVYLSTRPPKRLGSDDVWDKAEDALTEALKALNIPYTVNPGDGAFYGPKLDIMFTDALDRPWQLGTLQLDFNLPERFELKYIGDDNKEHRPVILHRAILGTLERFIGVFLEHTAGKLPTWLAPIQIQILNLTDRQKDYCEMLVKSFRANNIRVHFDDRVEKLGFKIREGQLQKIPYLVIVGEKEVETKTISVRLLGGEQKNALDLNQFINTLNSEIGGRLNKSPLAELKQEVSH